MDAERYDVAVVGGGPAGVAAALAAARCGARTLLVESAPGLGGNAAHAFVHTICGLFLDADAGDAVWAQPGLARRFAEALRAEGAAGAPERAGRVWVLPTDPVRLGRVAEARCRAAANLELRTGTALAGAALATEGDAPHRLWLGAERVPAWARVAVDASGDAALATAGGADVETPGPDELQLPSYIIRLGGVAGVDLSGFERLRVTVALAGAVREGTLPAGCDSVLLRPGARPGEAYATLGVPRPAGYDPLDAGQRAALEAQARERAEAVVAHLRRFHAGFERAAVAAWPARLGVRESRRLVGRVRLGRDDVLAGRRRDDEVALSSWPIELWHDHRRARFEHAEGPSSVPLGALVSRSHGRLGGAGRCMPGSHEALGALRVIGTALATGEAVGVTAALAADAGRDLDEIAPATVRAHIAGAEGPL